MRELKVAKVSLVKYIKENISEYANKSSDEYFEVNYDWGFSLNFFFQDILKDIELNNCYDQIQDVRFVNDYGFPHVEIRYYETDEDEGEDEQPDDGRFDEGADYHNPYQDWENKDSAIDQLISRVEHLEKQVQIMKQPKERVGW